MFSKDEQQTIDNAIKIISGSLKRKGFCVTNSVAVKNFCRCQIGSLESEVFGVLFLDVKNRLINFSKLFNGTVDQYTVYPREIAKEALLCNASRVIVTHNHPTGDVQPSTGDVNITKELRESLSLFEIDLLDHIVVSQVDALSFSEQGLL